jgi:hypothetical protein
MARHFSTEDFFRQIPNALALPLGISRGKAVPWGADTWANSLRCFSIRSDSVI